MKTGLDDFLKEKGNNDFRNLLQQSESVYDFAIPLLKQVPDEKLDAELHAIAKELIHEAPAFRATVIDKIHQATKIPKKVIQQSLEGANNINRGGQSANAASAQNNATMPEHLTDVGNAKRFAKMHRDKARFCSKRGRWFVWDGKRWKVDDTLEVYRLAEETVKSIYAEALSCLDKDEREDTALWALKSESRQHIDALVALARSESDLIITEEMLDQGSFLFNCLNGTLNLSTGELRPHRREDYITKLAPVEYDPDALCPRWMQFLDDIFGANTDVIKFVQKSFGYALTGDMREDKLFICYGTGANGKSTLLNTVQAMTGDYSRQAAPDVLLTDRKDTHPTGIADLSGARLVLCMETDEGKRLAEGLVKQMSGGDKMKGRFMRQDFFEFQPTFKIFLATNHKPDIRGTDYAIWRRLCLIPFMVTIPPDKQDKSLREHKFCDEWPGILAWVVRGCLLWKRQGLQEPAVVSEATQQYRDEMDLLKDWVNERCLLSPKFWESTENLYRDYEAFCKSNGDFVIKTRSFAKRLSEMGLTPKKRGVRGWQGICLRSEGGDSPREDIPDISDATSKIIPHETQPNESSENQRPNVPNVHLETPAEAPITSDKPKLCHSGTPPESGGTIPVQYVLVRDRETLQTSLAPLMSSDVLGIDVETEGLDPLMHQTRLIQIAAPGSPVVIVDLSRLSGEAMESLRELFVGKALKIFHNAKFDLKMLTHAGLQVHGPYFDTQLAEQLIMAGLYTKKDFKLGKFKLSFLVEKYLHQKLPKELQASDWGTELTTEQLEYAARDAAVLLPLQEILEAKLQEAGLNETAKLEFECLFAVCEIELNGALLDLKKLEVLGQALKILKDKTGGASKEFLKMPEINLNSHKQVKRALAAVSIRVDRTGKEVLISLLPNHPELAHLIEYRRLSSLLNTFVNGLPEHIHPLTKRVHAEYHQLGTDTGRFSCSNPNLQNIPNDHKFRESFVAAKGYKLVIADYSQIELRVAAEISQDKRMMQAFRQGDDLHRLTASIIMNKSIEAVTSEERRAAKPVNFGLIYGMGPSPDYA